LLIWTSSISSGFLTSRRTAAFMVDLPFLDLVAAYRCSASLGQGEKRSPHGLERDVAARPWRLYTDLMKRVVMAATASLVLAACEETPMGPEGTTGPPPLPAYGAVPPPSAFNPQEFAWSSERGGGSLSGAFGYRHGPIRYTCQGEDVLLIPETPWSRRRMLILYGSASAAAIPVSIVRARSPSAPSGDYARYVRRTTCDADNRFAFEGLPVGAWFVVTVGRPAQGAGEPIAVTRRVEIGGGPRTVALY
jgi:hypothetical protein